MPYGPYKLYSRLASSSNNGQHVFFRSFSSTAAQEPRWRTSWTFASARALCRFRCAAAASEPIHRVDSAAAPPSPPRSQVASAPDLDKFSAPVVVAAQEEIDRAQRERFEKFTACLSANGAFPGQPRGVYADVDIPANQQLTAHMVYIYVHGWGGCG